MKKPFRKNYTPEEKVAILRRHLIEKESISSICDRYQLQPTVFHRWLKEFFENGAAAFEVHKPDKKQDRPQQRIEKLEEKLKKKDEVLAELMEEYVIVKKSLGEIETSNGLHTTFGIRSWISSGDGAKRRRSRSAESSNG